MADLRVSKCFVTGLLGKQALCQRILLLFDLAFVFFVLFIIRFLAHVLPVLLHHPTIWLREAAERPVSRLTIHAHVFSFLGHLAQLIRLVALQGEALGLLYLVKGFLNLLLLNK